MNLIAAKAESLTRRPPVGMIEKNTGATQRLYYFLNAPDQAFSINA
jgi:hypothetical protein